MPRRWRRRARRSLGAALLLCSVALLALRGSLETVPLDPGYRGPALLPPEVAARFAYPEQGQPVRVEAIWDEQDHGDYTTRWAKLEVTTPGHPPHVVQVIHYRPAAGGVATRRPAVVVSPILGGSMALAKTLARALVQRSIHAAIVLKGERILDGKAPVARLERVLRTAVMDRRRTVDWLSEQPDVDPRRIGAMGVSLGALATTLLAAVEPRVGAAVLVLAGGDLPSLVTGSDEPGVRAFVREVGLGPEALATRLRAEVPSDPLVLAPCIDARKVLLVQARRDTTIPFVNQQLLAKALGLPQRIVLPTGHYTSAVYLPSLLRVAVRFLDERLAAIE